jgi:hypothetical protein
MLPLWTDSDVDWFLTRFFSCSQPRPTSSRVMRYTGVCKADSEPFNRFTRRKGGVNACADRFSRGLGRDAAKRSKRRLTRG